MSDSVTHVNDLKFNLDKIRREGRGLTIEGDEAVNIKVLHEYKGANNLTPACLTGFVLGIRRFWTLDGISCTHGDRNTGRLVTREKIKKSKEFYIYRKIGTEELIFDTGVRDIKFSDNPAYERKIFVLQWEE